MRATLRYLLMVLFLGTLLGNSAAAMEDCTARMSCCCESAPVVSTSVDCEESAPVMASCECTLSSGETPLEHREAPVPVSRTELPEFTRMVVTVLAEAPSRPAATEFAWPDEADDVPVPIPPPLLLLPNPPPSF